MSENYSLEQIVQIFIEESKKAQRELGQFNILIIGKTGVGKSTLINSVFDKDIAKIGTGRPITQAIQQYTKDNCPITIYDTPGLELNQEQADQVKEGVNKIIQEKKYLDIKEHIHVIWYCVNGSHERFEEGEEVWITNLVEQDEVPVIIVLTQTNDPEISPIFGYLQELNLPVNAIIPIMAQARKITTKISIPGYGLENLVEETAKLIPEQAERAFIHQQIASINLQAIQADKYLIAYVIGSTFIGAAEAQSIQFGALFGLQATMLANISVLFGLEFDEKFYTILTATIAGSGTVGDVGKAFVITLLTWIPGIAPVAAVVTATIAATMTFSLGRAYIEALKWYKLAKAKGEEIPPERLVGKIIELYKKLTGNKDKN
jgi:small GTP-binding protein